MHDYYKILEIPHTSSLKDIKQAYRKLVFKYHPDHSKNETSANQFILITEAYEVLKDSNKRREYDAIYDKFLRHNKIPSVQYSAQQSEWESEGKNRAKEYAAIPYEDLLKRLFEELSVAKKYTLNFALIGLCALAVCSTPVMFSIEPIMGLWGLALYGFLGYILYNRTSKDYRADRIKKFKNS